MAVSPRSFVLIPSLDDGPAKKTADVARAGSLRFGEVAQARGVLLPHEATRDNFWKTLSAWMAKGM
jgi:hypothetical protein